MEVLAGRPHELTPQLLESVERYRYKVFVEMLGWELDTPPGLERDLNMLIVLLSGMP